MSSSYFMNLLASAVAVILGIVIHESAHAAAAWALGDKTARSRGWRPGIRLRQAGARLP